MLVAAPPARRTTPPCRPGNTLAARAHLGPHPPPPQPPPPPPGAAPGALWQPPRPCGGRMRRRGGAARARRRRLVQPGVSAGRCACAVHLVRRPRVPQPVSGGGSPGVYRCASACPTLPMQVMSGAGGRKASLHMPAAARPRRVHVDCSYSMSMRPACKEGLQQRGRGGTSQSAAHSQSLPGSCASALHGAGATSRSQKSAPAASRSCAGACPVLLGLHCVACMPQYSTMQCLGWLWGCRLPTKQSRPAAGKVGALDATQVYARGCIGRCRTELLHMSTCADRALAPSCSSCRLRRRHGRWCGAKWGAGAGPGTRTPPPPLPPAPRARCCRRARCWRAARHPRRLRRARRARARRRAAARRRRGAPQRAARRRRRRRCRARGCA